MGPNDVVIKVYFVDGSYKSLYVGENDTTSKVVQAILEKVTFPKTKGLQLFTYLKDSDIHHQEIQENECPGGIYKKLDQEKGSNFKMVLKRKKDNFKGWTDDGASSSSLNSSKELTKPPSRPPPNPSNSRDRTASFSVSESPQGGDQNNTQPPIRASTLRGPVGGGGGGGMGTNLLMSELTLKRNQLGAQNQNILKQTPKKEQSQTIIIDWVNKKLEEFSKSDYMIENLEGDLKNGCVLAVLLEGLSGLNVGKEFNRTPNTKIQMIENNNIVLRFLKVLGVNLTNINGEDLWETRPETMMRFLGIVIKHFHDSTPGKTKARLSMLVSTQQLNQLQQPNRKPPPPVRKLPPTSNSTAGVPLPPPIASESSVNNTSSPQIPAVQLRKVAPPPNSQAKSAGYVAKPPPKIAAKVPQQTSDVSVPPPVVAKKQPPLPSRNQASSPPINDTPLPPPIVAKKQPPLPVRTHQPQVSEQTVEQPTPAISKKPLPAQRKPLPNDKPSELPTPAATKKPLPKPQTNIPTTTTPIAQPEKKIAKPPVPTRTFAKPNPVEPSVDTFNIPPPIIDQTSEVLVMGSPSKMPLPPPPQSPPINNSTISHPTALPPPPMNINTSNEDIQPVEVPQSIAKKKPPPPPRSQLNLSYKPVIEEPEVVVEEPVVVEETYQEEQYQEQYQEEQYHEEQYNYEEQQQQEEQYYETEQHVEESQHIEQEIHQSEDVVIKLDNDEEITFEELELILNNNNLNFDDLLKEHNEAKLSSPILTSNNNNDNFNFGAPTIDINNLETSIDMKSSSHNTVEDDLADLLDKLSRGEF